MFARLALIIAFFSLTTVTNVNAFQDSPVDHMNALGTLEENLSKKYLSYSSEVAHGERARKMEKRREDLINSIKASIREGGKLRPYKGDASLRDAYTGYWGILLSVFNEDYHKIVDMEEVAEQSYDGMEAFLLMKEKAAQKQSDAYDKVGEAYTAFAAKNNVRLTEAQTTKLSRKLTRTAQVNRYMNEMFLVYFKSSVQEANMIKAQNAKDANGIEQSRNAMIKYAKEGLARLDTIKPYKGDGSLINANRKVMDYFISEGETKVPVIINFLLKETEFEKIRKSYDSKKQDQRTSADVDAYNKAVGEFNKAVADFNKANGEMNAGRAKVLTQWETSRKQFLDRHVPYK